MSRFQWFVDACKSAEYDVRDYSGRGMGGRSCLGVDIKDIEPFVFAADLLDSVSRDNVGTLARVLRDARTDSMGRGTIVYFPMISWQDSWDDDQDEENEDEDE